MNAWLDAMLLLTLAAVSAFMWWLAGTGKATNVGDGKGPRRDTPGTSFFPAVSIRQAGYHPDDLRQVYWTAKCLLPLLLVLSLAEFGGGGWLAYGGIAVAGLLLPDALLYWRRRRRQRRIRVAVSYFLDLVVSFLAAGMTLAEAFRRTSTVGFVAGHPLADEVRLMAVELDAGRPRQAAFDLLARRTGVAELAHLAAVVGMGKHSGAPMIELLRAQADRLRDDQERLYGELLGRKSIESLFPMVLVSLPMFLVLVFFPTGVQVLRAYEIFRLSW